MECLPEYVEHVEHVNTNTCIRLGSGTFVLSRAQTIAHNVGQHQQQLQKCGSTLVKKKKRSHFENILYTNINT